jgi:hypothetical protein
MTYPNGNLEGMKRYYSVNELSQEIPKEDYSDSDSSDLEEEELPNYKKNKTVQIEDENVISLADNKGSEQKLISDTKMEKKMIITN